MLKKIILWLGMINIIIFLLMFKKPPKKLKQLNYDCAVVCGYPAMKDGRPSQIMKTRVEKAVQLYREGRVKYLILSGGSVHNKYPEAAVMAQYALKLKVPKEIIIKDNEAKCTYDNLKNADKIMKDHHFNSCLVVTNSWHLRKASHYAQKFKLNYAMITAKRPEKYSLLKVLILHLETNFIMYRNMFKGYY